MTNCIRVPLTQGLFALIDADDAERVLAFRWYALNTGRNKVYAVRNIRLADGRRTTEYLHRFLLDAPTATVVDHRNGDGLDCTRANLRLTTQAQNAVNVGKSRRNASGYIGVTWDAERSAWVAQIQHRGKHIHIGRFGTREEAAQARALFATQLHGEFASRDEVQS